jgi:hypothetical protein
MLRSSKELTGYKIAATDGEIGKIKDFLFDENHWTVRWLVADTGSWLAEHKVLISPITLGDPARESRLLPVRLTKRSIELSPSLDFDAPVSREYEKEWFDSHGWSYYWAGASVWGTAYYPGDLFTREEKESELDGSPEKGQDVLRSVEEVRGYRIDAADGEIGHVDQFIVDDTTWTIRYMVVDTGTWLPGRKVLISPPWIESVKWAEKTVSVIQSRNGIKGSPEYDPAAPVNREYEARLYDYYGRPVYWANEK